jgi:hypothetical protein
LVQGTGTKHVQQIDEKTLMKGYSSQSGLDGEEGDPLAEKERVHTSLRLDFRIVRADWSTKPAKPA